MNPRLLAMVPALTVVLVGCVIVWVVGFGSAGIEDGAAPIVERARPSVAPDAEAADFPQQITTQSSLMRRLSMKVGGLSISHDSADRARREAV
jgi:hypothetical protein